MSITTNGELKAFLTSASMRSDLAGFMQDFVNRAHAVIARSAIVYAPVTISAQAIVLPTDFGFAHSLWILRAPMAQLTQVSQDQLALLNTAGLPGWYNIAESQVGPAPDQTYEGRLLYRVSPTLFAADGDTNAILTSNPFLYVYGAMAELSRFNFDAATEAARETAFEAAIEEHNQAEEARALAGAALQLTPSVCPV